MRIALFSEVYWPMVSGVGVTLLRLTKALQHGATRSGCTPPAMRFPRASRTAPRCTARPACRFFLYPDVQWAFPRMRDIVEDLRAFQPDVVHVATEFALGLAGVKAARQLRLPVIASAHTDYDQYAARYGVDWAVRLGWHYLRWFYGQAYRVLCPSRIYRAAPARSRGVMHTGIWSRGVDPLEFHPRFRSEAYRAGSRRSAPTISWSPTSAA